MTIDALCNNAKSLINCVYCYGAKYEVVNEQNIKKWASNSPSIYTVDYINKCRGKVGKMGIDCSGLICHAAQIPHIGSYDMHKNWNHVPIKQVKKGMVVWKEGHVALVLKVMIGGFKVIEAKGINFDVQINTYNFNDFKIGLKIPTVEYNVYEGWVKIGDNWRYYDDNFNYFKNCIKRIKWTGGQDYFCFDKDGYMCKDICICTIDENGCVKGVGKIEL